MMAIDRKKLRALQDREDKRFIGEHPQSAELFAKAKTLFGPHKLVDLVLLMGNYAGTAALLTAVDMQLHKGKEPLLPIP